MCAGYYSYRAGLHARVRGQRALRGHDRPSAAVARGPRLRGQAGRRDRLGRDRDDAGAGDGEGRRPHRHAAALADLRRLASRQGRDRQRAAQGAARALGLRDHALEERRAAAVLLPPHAHATRSRSSRSCSTWCARSSGPDYDVETHFTPRYNPWDQRLCLVPNSDLFEAIRSGKASVVTDHIERFTETGIELAVGRAARRRHHRHGDRPEPRRAGRDAVRRRRRAGRFRADLDLQGHDVLRRAEPGLDVRLHQRLVDAARRPHRRVRLPAAQPHGRDAARAR